MRILIRGLFSLSLAAAGLLSLNAAAAAPGPLPSGLRAIVQSAIPADQPIRAVAMFDAVPTPGQAQALRDAGLIAQPLRHLPMALTKGTVPQLLRLFEDGAVRDFYIDQKLDWHSDVSTEAMNAHLTRELGYIGTGVGIAIVDSGIDASHPSLAQRVVRNVRVYSPEYLDITGVSQPLGITWPSEPALVLPFDALPYNNTDTIGHGTHVAGIAAGDASNNPVLIGVAPGADLIGYSTGEILFIFTALASFDDILATHEDYNIRVINNSWGSGFSLFDPDAPINVATRVLYEQGITVVFSAGNSSDEMTTGPNSNAPWVINVCSATVSKQKSGFSSSGLMFDNTDAKPLDADGHVHFEGDGLGITRPDVCAPGSSIRSTGTPTGVVVTPGSPPGGAATASGTSMAAPHIAGLAAVLLQANPALTPDQIRMVLQVTAGPMDDDGESAFWQIGYGFVDAKAALDLVLREDFSQALLDEMQAAADARVRAARSHKVVASDHWMFVERGVTVAGIESYDYTLQVGDGVDAIRASVAFAGDLSILIGNFLFEWSLTLTDPDGTVVATSESWSGSTGVYGLQYDAEPGSSLKPGRWTLTASGELHLAQPGLLWGHLVSVSATQLALNDDSTGKSAGRFGGGLPAAVLLLLVLSLLLRRRRA
jgi:serine protease AprX